MRTSSPRTGGPSGRRPLRGGEQGSAQAYKQPLEETMPRLVERLKQKRYRATRVRGPASPQGEGTPRPLGSPAGEDKLRQRAVARLLEALDAQDCRRGR